jgi:serine/threonine protein kinase
MRAELALHAVNGMAYLHEMKIVHFDLKPDNLLLDGPIMLGCPDTAPTLKVADFGLSKHKWSAYVSGVRDLRCVVPARALLNAVAAFVWNAALALQGGVECMQACVLP